MFQAIEVLLHNLLELLQVRGVGVLLNSAKQTGYNQVSSVEISGFLVGQWMFTDNYLNKLGSQPIPHLVDSVSRSSILLKEMLPFAIYRPNPQPTFTANSLGWSSNHLPSWGQAHSISLLDYNSHLPSQ